MNPTVKSQWLAALSILALALTGCRDVEEVAVSTPPEKGTRFNVQSQGAFEAGYGNHPREILILTDTKTGKQYLAVTGCGTTEMHTEGSGKNAHTVEE